MRDGEPLQLPVIVEDVDRAPIRDRRHRQSRDRLERGRVIERCAQRCTGFGQKRGARPSAVGGLMGRALLCVKLGQPRFDGAPFGNVSRDLRCADDRAAGVADRRDGHRHFHQPSVLAHPDGLEVFDPLAAADLREHDVFFAQAVRRDQHRDRLADSVCGRVAEQALSAAIPRGDDAVQILADNRVVRRLDDGGESKSGVGWLR